MGACSNNDDTDDTTPTTGKLDITTKDKDKTVTVTFDLNYTGAAAPTTASVAKDKNATKPADPTRDGYTFGGWYEKQDGSGTAFAFDTTTITKAITLYAKWTAIITYTVTFDVNGGTAGTAPAPQTVKTGDITTEPTTISTRTNFIFVGWYTDKVATKAFNFTTTPITADITLYAGWSNDAVTITFATGEGASTVPVKNVKKGTTTTPPTPPERTGYTFDNWYTDEATTKVFAFTTPITADITLYAGWTPVYTVTFNGNYPGAAAATTVAVAKDSKATKPTDPTRDGHIFNGWYDAKTGGNEFNFATTTITADITLFARWTAVTAVMVTVTFDLNGGTGTAPTPVTVEHGKTTTKPADPTRDGYTFGGWYDAKTAGNQFVFDTTTITADITLFARWTAVTAVMVTVTFDLNGGTGTAPTPVTVEHGKTTTKPADPTRDGYTFGGWYDAKTAGNQFVFDTPITTDITLYARWTAYSVTVTLDSKEYTLTPDDKIDKILSIVVDKTYAALHKIKDVTIKTVHLPGITNPAVGGTINLTDGRGSITATQGGVDTPYTVKLMIKPKDKTELTTIVNAAIDTTNGEGDTANLNFVDTSLMTDMSDLFKGKNAFNGNLSEWDTAKVENMNGMFNSAYAFNQDIGSWKTGKVTNMYQMFSGASAFNQTIGKWNTAKVTNMREMFSSAYAFNQDIGDWKTGKVTTMVEMFFGAIAFDQNLSGWDVGKVTDHDKIFSGSAMKDKTTQHPKFK